MKKYLFIPVVLLSLVLSACGAAATPAYSNEVDIAAQGMPAAAATAAPALARSEATSKDSTANLAPGADAGGQHQDPAATPATGGKRILLLNANYTLQVNDPQVAANKIIDLAIAKSGWVVSSQIAQGNYYGPRGEKYFSGTVAIRIPAERLDETMKEIEALAVEVTNRQITGQDVTQDYTDLQARLNNNEATATQLRQMIADLRGAGYDTDKPEVVTAKVQALSQLSNQLDAVQGEIDSMKGRLQYYNESAAYSIITVNLQPFIPSQPIEVAGWHPDGVAKEALQNLINALEGLVDTLIRLGICGIPALLILALFCSPFFFIGRAIYRRSRKA
jgi:hypothetical protein